MRKLLKKNWGISQKHRCKWSKGRSLDQILLKAMKPLLEKVMNAETGKHLEYNKYEKIYQAPSLKVVENSLNHLKKSDLKNIDLQLAREEKTLMN